MTRLRAAHGFKTPLFLWLQDALRILDGGVEQVTEAIHDGHIRDLCNSVVGSVTGWRLYYGLIKPYSDMPAFQSAHYKENAFVLLSAAAAAVPCFPLYDPISAAVATGKQEVITFILQKAEENLVTLSATASSEPRIVVQEQMTTLLTMALKNRHFDLAELLLRNGLEVDNITDVERGVTALWDAADLGKVEVVRFLLEHGVDPESQSAWRAPMQVAEERGRQDVIDVFVAARHGRHVHGG